MKGLRKSYEELNQAISNEDNDLFVPQKDISMGNTRTDFQNEVAIEMAKTKSMNMDDMYVQTSRPSKFRLKRSVEAS